MSADAATVAFDRERDLVSSIQISGDPNVSLHGIEQTKFRRRALQGTSKTAGAFLRVNPYLDFFLHMPSVLFY
jgi:hypothetical protein